MTGGRIEWWRWPLWSWRHLAVTLLVAATLLAALGRVSTLGDPAPKGAPDPVMSTASPEAQPGSSSAPYAPTASTAAGETGPDDVALAFVRTWARPNADITTWRSECASFATGRLAKVLESSSSASVPSSRALGSADIVERSEAAARVRVPTDGGAVLVSLERVRTEWRVDDIGPEPPPALTGSPLD
ncbi:hypothetical protein G7075_14170 [Phycicoccus sp. HDW14]|uniref:hypothetical protein n=1 Tax=Phycicoccus sp. HDW14 TaxID=2714941 RepID=UPI00140D3942|nr:hypothetical protein [Phycicoccus sp. HDW14]QIM22015.1 hypothetical protein G7075_14170 [Phycicoccus sp. HDW14]